MKMNTFKRRPYIIDEETWACPNHLPTLKMPRASIRCWMCGAAQPQILKVVKVKNKNSKKEGKTIYCAWNACNKGPDNTRAKSRPNSKYCSRKCSNDNARWRHKIKGETK